MVLNNHMTLSQLEIIVANHICQIFMPSIKNREDQITIMTNNNGLLS